MCHWVSAWVGARIPSEEHQHYLDAGKEKTHVGKANFGDDGKARNVIVDDEDAAWLIDFGGGFTEGWVSEELAGTVEGDEEAVKKIVDFLGVWHKDYQMQE